MQFSNTSSHTGSRHKKKQACTRHRSTIRKQKQPWQALQWLQSINIINDINPSSSQSLKQDKQDNHKNNNHKLCNLSICLDNYLLHGNIWRMWQRRRSLTETQPPWQQVMYLKLCICINHLSFISALFQKTKSHVYVSSQHCSNHITIFWNWILVNTYYFLCSAWPMG